MSLLNTQRFNEGYIATGFASTAAMSPAGTVLVDGTASFALRRTVHAAQSCRATSATRMNFRRQLNANTDCSVESDNFMDLDLVSMQATQVCSVEHVAPLGLKQRLYAQTAGLVTSQGRLTRKRSAAGLGTLPSAESDTRISQALALTVGEPLQVESDTQAQVLRALQVDQAVSVDAQTLAGQAVAVGTVRELALLSDAVATRRRGLLGRSALSALSETKVSLVRGLMVSGTPMAVSEAVPSGYQWHRLNAGGAPMAVSEAVLTLKRALYVAELVQVIGASVVANSRHLRASGDLRALSFANLEERDLRPAPEDRLMLVPQEDRKMMVA